MTKKIVSIIAFLIALVINLCVFYLMLCFGLKYYNPNESFMNQHIVVWVFLFVIYFAGMESVVSSLIKRFSEKKETK